MEKENWENKTTTSVEETQKVIKSNRPPRLVSGKSSLAQIIRTKEQAEDFMEMLERKFKTFS